MANVGAVIPNPIHEGNASVEVYGEFNQELLLPKEAYEVPSWRIVEGECNNGIIKGTVYRGPSGLELVLGYNIGGDVGRLRFRLSSSGSGQVELWMVDHNLCEPILCKRGDDHDIVETLLALFKEVDGESQGVLELSGLTEVLWGFCSVRNMPVERSALTMDLEFAMAKHGMQNRPSLSFMELMTLLVDGSIDLNLPIEKATWKGVKKLVKAVHEGLGVLPTESNPYLGKWDMSSIPADLLPYAKLITVTLWATGWEHWSATGGLRCTTWSSERMKVRGVLDAKINGGYECCNFQGEVMAEDGKGGRLEDGTVGKCSLIAMFESEQGVTGLLRLHMGPLTQSDQFLLTSLVTGNEIAPPLIPHFKILLLELRPDCFVTADSVGGPVVVPPGCWYPAVGWGGAICHQERPLRLPPPACGFTRPLEGIMRWAPGFIGNGPCKIYPTRLDLVYSFANRDSFPHERKGIFGVFISRQFTGSFKRATQATIEPLEPRRLSLGLSVLVLVIYPFWFLVVLLLSPVYAVVLCCTVKERLPSQGKAYRRPEHDWGVRWATKDLSQKPTAGEPITTEACAELLAKHKTNAENPTRGSPRSTRVRSSKVSRIGSCSDASPRPTQNTKQAQMKADSVAFTPRHQAPHHDADIYRPPKMASFTPRSNKPDTEDNQCGAVMSVVTAANEEHIVVEMAIAEKEEGNDKKIQQGEV